MVLLWQSEAKTFTKKAALGYAVIQKLGTLCTPLPPCGWCRNSQWWFLQGCLYTEQVWNWGRRRLVGLRKRKNPWNPGLNMSESSGPQRLRSGEVESQGGFYRKWRRNSSHVVWQPSVPLAAWLYFLLVVRPWASGLTFLSHCFHLCKMESGTSRLFW
jgi:hypothetical protein